MNGDKPSKNVFLYCDCVDSSKRGGCSHCQSHQKGFLKRHWRHWRRWNRHHINNLTTRDFRSDMDK